MNTMTKLLTAVVCLPLTWYAVSYTAVFPFYLIMTYWDMPFFVHVLSWVVSGTITIVLIIPTLVFVGWISRKLSTFFQYPTQGKSIA